MTHTLDADPLNRDLTRVGRALHVGHHEGRIHLIHFFVLSGKRRATPSFPPHSKSVWGIAPAGAVAKRQVWVLSAAVRIKTHLRNRIEDTQRQTPAPAGAG
jgi:hypothetical protein